MAKQKSMRAQQQKMAVPFPVKGFQITGPMGDQPPLTSQDMQNVLAYPAADQRSRGGQRGGFPRASTLTGGVTPVSGMWTAPYISGGSVAYKSVAFNSSGSISAGANFTGLTTWTAIAGFGGASAPICSTDIFGIIYAAQPGGTRIATYNLSTAATGLLAASAGTRPASVGIVVNWRSRLCCAGDTTALQNLYMSRAGVPTDFDYSQTDDLAAVALNASSQAGRVGQPITALCPLFDDIMVIGCSDSIFLLEGDPAQGGTLVCLSSGIGMIAQQLWTVNPKGDLYFWGTRGFYRLKRGTRIIEKLSENRTDLFFDQMGLGTFPSWPAMCYDHNKRGVWISGGFSVPSVSAVMFYDETNDAFFPQILPLVVIPSSMAMSGDGAFYTGGFDGNIYTYDETIKLDNGSAIVSYAEIGPFTPAGMGMATLTDLEIFMGNQGGLGTLGLKVTVTATKAPYESIANVGNKSFTFTTSTNGRQKHLRQRLSGRSFLIRVEASAANAFWDIDQIAATFMRAADITR
jgi:hypothetical protein